MTPDPLFEREKRWLLNERYNGTETVEYFTDLEKLKNGEPVDYLIGHREFLGCQIDLSHRPLIPRNETEYWTQQVIDQHLSAPSTENLRALDIFAGSGCVGIALLKHLPHCTVDFIEKNPAFVEQIQKNLELNHIDPSRYTIYQSDMFSSLPSPTSSDATWERGRVVWEYGESEENKEEDMTKNDDEPGHQYDLIVANPPYIAHDRTNTVQNSVHDHEDHDSLYADDDGLYFIKKTIEALPQYLAPGGSCLIEYDPWQTDLITLYLETNHPNLSHQIIPDQFNKNRIMLIFHILYR